MKIKKSLYYGAHRMIGSSLGAIYEQYRQEDATGVPATTVKNHLIQLLDHCIDHVPYYRAMMETFDQDYATDPVHYLQKFPRLTKALIRENFEQLTSDDIGQRQWNYNTSGGSTGQPVRFIQDRAFSDRQHAIQLLSYCWAGREFGDPATRIWGSERDILQGDMGWKMKTLNHLTNDEYFNAFRMTPERMRTFLAELNAKQPHLIIAYAQAMFELALFAESEGIAMRPQKAILTSACTLYPFMREQIERIFGCKVFDRYGSREVGDIACECPEHNGLHVFPWGNYVEVLDDEGQPVPPGIEGNIVVTCMTNYAMPLIRYELGDRGILSAHTTCACGRSGQILEKIVGRNVDAFKTKDGTLIDGEYFTHLLYFRNWVERFQVIQTDYSSILFKIVQSAGAPTEVELDTIIRDTRAVMGTDCEVNFLFLSNILPTVSGKYRYTISEIS